MQRRVTVQWTKTALDGLKKLPKKVAKGLWEKVGPLRDCDPRQPNKPLTGPLQGYYHIAYSRYRAIYSVELKEIQNGQVVVHFMVQCVVVGQRKKGDKRDIYVLAKKLLDLGIIETGPSGKGKKGK